MSYLHTLTYRTFHTYRARPGDGTKRTYRVKVGHNLWAKRTCDTFLLYGAGTVSTNRPKPDIWPQLITEQRKPDTTGIHALWGKTDIRTHHGHSHHCSHSGHRPDG